jgi:hypothetical protein
LRGSLENLDGQSQKSRRKEKNRKKKKKRLSGLKYMFVQDTPTKDGGAAEKI